MKKDKNNIINIGGGYYTNILDNASSSNGSNTLVKRDVGGNITLNMATILLEPSANTDVVNKQYVDSKASSGGNTIIQNTTSVSVNDTTILVVANNSEIASFTDTLITLTDDVNIIGNISAAYINNTNIDGGSY